jgi:voltage-gated potassium channel
MPSVIFLVFRRMRSPLILLIVVYALSVLGFSLIPGVDAQGAPAAPMSFFHAFYFVSYTATTIGFGELPVAFSEAQRMWTTVTIYLSVIGWSYVIFKLFAIAQDSGFQQAVASARFERRVRRLAEPFYLICGCGETGGLLLRALDRMNLRCVVVDLSQARIDELDLEDLGSDAITLAGDVRSPQLLEMAGLTHRHCRAVITLTDDDRANLAVCASASLLNPQLPVIARVQSNAIAANMASFGIRHRINPFEKFADYLRLAIQKPGSYRLMDWLLALPGTQLRRVDTLPRGHWLICGHGRFGSAVEERLGEEGTSLRIIEPAAPPEAGAHVLRGIGTEARVLEQAGLRDAAGVVIGTNDDVTNLAIAVTARELNPRAFLVVRQNLVANRRLFEGIDADILMVPSEIIAHECFALLTSPMLDRFLDLVHAQSDDWASALIARLRGIAGERAPHLWSIRIDAEQAPAMLARIGRPDGLTSLGEVMRDPLDREQSLRLVALLRIRHDGQADPLPASDTTLRAGDEILFAGTRTARARLELTMRNANELNYVCTGIDRRGGWLGQRLATMIKAPTVRKSSH